MEKPVVICGYKRSPFHFANKGDLAKVRPDDMAAVILTSLWRTLHFRQIRLEEQIAWYRAVKYQR